MSLKGRNLVVPTALMQNNASRESADITKRSINNSPFLNFEGRLIEFKNTGATAIFEIPHGLGFKPRDTVVVSLSNYGFVTFFHDSFTDETVKLELGEGVSVRFLAGTFRG